MAQDFGSYRLLLVQAMEDCKAEIRLARVERKVLREDVTQMKVWVTLVSGVMSAAVTAVFMALVELVIK